MDILLLCCSFFLFLISSVAILTTSLYFWHKSNVSTYRSRVEQGRSRRKKQEQEDQEQEDVVVVGAGVVGSALGAVLARDGRKVTIIERSLTPHPTFAGEALMPGGVQTLNQLGLGDCLSGTDGVECTGITLRHQANGHLLNMPFPAEGIAFHHANFVSSLRNAVQEEKRCTLVEGTVLRLVEEKGIIKGVQYRRKGEEQERTLRAKMVVLCEGSYSRLRKVNVNEKPKSTGYFVGFEVEGHVMERGQLDMSLTKEGFSYVYGISPTASRVMVNVAGALPKHPAQYLNSITKQLPSHFQESVGKVFKETAMKSIPTYRMSAGTIYQPGVLTLGDAFNIRHPVTGCGQTVGLKDVKLWRDILDEIEDLEDYETLYWASKVWVVRRKLYFTVLTSVFANTLADVLAPSTAAGNGLRDGFVDYLNLGKQNTEAFMRIFSILDTNPLYLYYLLIHGSAYAAYATLKKARSLHEVVTSLGVFPEASRILLSNSWAEWRTLFLQKAKCD